VPAALVAKVKKVQAQIAAGTITVPSS
jgi:hypothetical protein